MTKKLEFRVSGRGIGRTAYRVASKKNGEVQPRLSAVAREYIAERWPKVNPAYLETAPPEMGLVQAFNEIAESGGVPAPPTTAARPRKSTQRSMNEHGIPEAPRVVDLLREVK